MSLPSSLAPERRGLGRPREFDMDTALDAALLVFREQGYHAASMGQLGAAMRLTPGSIYKAFADKRALFLAAFDRYAALRGAALGRAGAAERPGLDKLRAALRCYAEVSYGTEGRRGCLVAGSAAALASLDAGMARHVTAALARTEDFVRRLIRLGQDDGSIPAGLDADAAARAVLCLMQGVRIVGKGGRTRAEMVAAVDHALRLVA